METSSLDYPLPDAAIAQQPVEPRDRARLLVAAGVGAEARHRQVRDLPDLLDPGDVLVVNDTRVIPARLLLRKATGGQVEVLLLERRPDEGWEALVRPSRRVADGAVLRPQHERADGPAPEVTVRVGPVLGDDGRRLVEIHGGGGDDLDLLAALGQVPLPPYVHEALEDPERYQTVYARRPSSVAAPTAGLHLTHEVLDACRRKGIVVVPVELSVGLGTFRPITADRVEDHPMHEEAYCVPAATIDAIAARTGRVVAVGTTVVRALESWTATGEPEGRTRLFLHGAHRFGVVDRLMTNFHVPRSSLLALVEAFAGPGWRDLYAEALAAGYRFLSFGDAMLLDPRAEPSS